MYRFDSRNGEPREVKLIGHIDEFEFAQMCDGELVPGSVKLIWEAMRFEGKKIKYIKCDRTTFGARPVTIGVVR